MLECKVGNINIFNPIEGKLDRIIEYFVEFYGEKYRERITSRLKNSTILFLGNTSLSGRYTTKNVAQSYFNGKLGELFSDFEKNSGYQGIINFRVENIDTLIQELNKNVIYNFNARTYLKILNSMGLVKIPRDISNDGYKEFFKENIDENLLKILKDELNKIKNIFDASKEEYELQLKQKDEVLNVLNNIESGIQDVLTENDEKIQALIQNYILTNFNRDISKFGEDKKKAYIEAFKDLIEKKTKFYTTYDKSNYIELFNFLGVKEEIFENYLKNPKIRQILKDKDFLKSYWDINRELEYKIKENCVYLNETMNYIKSLNFFPNPEILRFVLEDFIINNFGVSGYVFPMNIDNKLHCVCLLSEYFSLDTSSLVHEFNHIVECDRLVDSTGKFKGFKTGFSAGTLASDAEELLDEIVNDYISLKVNKLMERDGFNVGGAGYMPSAYSKVFPLLEGFIEENLNDIIACRMSSDSKAFARKIGEENFCKVVEAVGNYYEIGDRDKIELAYQELKNFKGDLTSKLERKKLSSNANVLYDSISLVKEVRKSVKQQKATIKGTESAER